MPIVRHRSVLFALALFYCYEYFLRITPALYLNELIQHWHTTAKGLSYIVSAYYLGYTLGQLPAGICLDHYPKRQALTFAALISAILLYSLPHIQQPFWAFCCFLGLGCSASFAFIGVLTMGLEFFPQYFTRIIALSVALAMLLSANLQIFSAHLLSYFQWETLIQFTAWLGLITALLLWCYLPQHLPTTRVIKLKEALRSLISRPFLVNALIGGLYYFPINIFTSTWGISILKLHHGFSLIQATYLMLIFQCTRIIGTLLIGWICDRVPNGYAWLLPTILLTTLGFLLFIYYPSLSLPWTCAALFAIGLGAGGDIIVWRLFKQFIINDFHGTASAITNMIISLTTASMGLLIGHLLSVNSETISNLHQLTREQFYWGFACLPISLLSALGLYLIVLRKHLKRQPTATTISST